METVTERDRGGGRRRQGRRPEERVRRVRRVVEKARVEADGGAAGEAGGGGRRGAGAGGSDGERCGGAEQPDGVDLAPCWSLAK